jgi:hypothetical protein
MAGCNRSAIAGLRLLNTGIAVGRETKHRDYLMSSLKEIGGKMCFLHRNHAVRMVD